MLKQRTSSVEATLKQCLHHVFLYASKFMIWSKFRRNRFDSFVSLMLIVKKLNCSSRTSSTIKQNCLRFIPDGQNSSQRMASAERDIGQKKRNWAWRRHTLGTLLKCWANTRTVALKCLDATKLLTKSFDPMNFVCEITSSNIKHTCGAFADPNSSINRVWWA